MLKYRYFLLALICYGLLIFPAQSQGNPFLKPSSSESASPQSSPLEAAQPPSFLRDLTSTFRTQQAAFQNQLAEKSHTLVTEGQTHLWFILIITAFLYGAFHSLGPGHGKCVVCSYFTAEKADIRKGLLLGYLVAIVHSISAFTIVGIVYFFLKGSSQLIFDQATRYISLVGYGLISLLGLVLLLQRLYRPTQQKQPAEDCSHTDCSHIHEHSPPPRKSLWLAALAIGIIPCPGALTILLFSLSLNTLKLGVILACMIALGMGLTISLLAISTVISRQQAFKWLNETRASIHAPTFEKYLGLGGALITFMFGGTLFLISW